MPNLYNGNPDFLHTIDVTYTQAGSPTLEAFRLVKAYPVVAIKDNIVNPPEYDSDGLPYVITLPDVASPTAAQRSLRHRGRHGLDRDERRARFHQRHGHDQR